MKSIDEIAHEVLDGKWSYGPDRISALRDAGYDYIEVQSRINELVMITASRPSLFQKVKMVVHNIVLKLRGDNYE